MKNALIINGGENTTNRDQIGEFDFIVAVDSGAEHAYKLFLKPDLIIGDLDSIDKKIYERVAKDKIEIIDGRHPVVEESLFENAQEFTPNDCVMNKNNFAWLMTGPNMAGKSTFLRQTAIIIILNQIGSFVPAKSANLGVFDKVFTRIELQTTCPRVCQLL